MNREVTLIVLACLSGPLAACGRGAPAKSQPNTLADARIAYSIRDSSGERLAIRKLTGGSSRIVALPGRERGVDIESIAWAPDGKRLAVSDSSGRLFVVSVDGPPRQLDLGGGARPRDVSVGGWSPDGAQLAVTSATPGCAPDEPSLLVVPVDGTAVTRLSARLPGAPSTATDPAFIESFGWSSDGEALIYIWSQYNGECRGIELTTSLVMSIPADGSAGPRELTEAGYGRDLSPSPTDGRLAVAESPVDSDNPLDWRPDGSAVVIVTTPDVDVQVVDEAGRTTAEATIPDGDYTIAVYEIDSESGAYELLRTLKPTDSWLTALGNVSGGRGMVARIETLDSAIYPRSARMTLIPLDGSPRRTLPALRAPAGTRVGFAAAVGSRTAGYGTRIASGISRGVFAWYFA